MRKNLTTTNEKAQKKRTTKPWDTQNNKNVNEANKKCKQTKWVWAHAINKVSIRLLCSYVWMRAKNPTTLTSNLSQRKRWLFANVATNSGSSRIDNIVIMVFVCVFLY